MATFEGGAPNFHDLVRREKLNDDCNTYIAMRKNKTGRRASQEERDLAQQLVDRYLLAEQSPNGSICINPERPESEHEFFHANVDELLAVIQGFATHGTFQFVEEFEFEVADIQQEFDDLRLSGKTYADAVHLLAEKFSKSERTIERALAFKTHLYARR